MRNNSPARDAGAYLVHLSIEQNKFNLATFFCILRRDKSQRIGRQVARSLRTTCSSALPIFWILLKSLQPLATTVIACRQVIGTTFIRMCDRFNSKGGLPSYPTIDRNTASKIVLSALYAAIEQVMSLSSSQSDERVNVLTDMSTKQQLKKNARSGAMKVDPTFPPTLSRVPP